MSADPAQPARWVGTPVQTVTCFNCDQAIELSDDAKPGDIVQCCGLPQRLAYEFGSWATEPA